MAFFRKWIIPAWWIFFICYNVFMLFWEGWKSNEFVFGKMMGVFMGAMFLWYRFDNKQREKNSSTGP